MVLQNRRTVYPHCWIGHFYPPLRRFHHKRGAEEGVGGDKEGEERDREEKEGEERGGQMQGAIQGICETAMSSFYHIPHSNTSCDV